MTFITLVLFAVLPSPAELRKLPEVAKVEVHNEGGTRKIIHICDWHWISREAFLLDGGTEEEYDAFLTKVEAVQQEQMQVLRALGVKKVWVEGQSDQTIDAFRKSIKALKAVKPPSGDLPVDELLRELYREDLLEIGAAGRLLLAGEIDEVLPLEDHDAWRAANPVREGKLVFDQKAIERREKVMVSRLANAEEAVIVLGRDHRLTELKPHEIAYSRVIVKSVQQLILQASK